MDSSTITPAAAEDHARGLLRQTPYAALRGVSCECHAGQLILRGRLPSFFLKQMAQSAVARVPGVERVVNHIEVVPIRAHAARN
jgi:hypothetical protein